jgi:hypothetical protein
MDPEPTEEEKQDRLEDLADLLETCTPEVCF